MGRRYEAIRTLIGLSGLILAQGLHIQRSKSLCDRLSSQCGADEHQAISTSVLTHRHNRKEIQWIVGSNGAPATFRALGLRGGNRDGIKKDKGKQSHEVHAKPSTTALSVLFYLSTCVCPCFVQHATRISPVVSSSKRFHVLLVL